MSLKCNEVHTTHSFEPIKKWKNTITFRDLIYILKIGRRRKTGISVRIFHSFRKNIYKHGSSDLLNTGGFVYIGKFH